MQNINTNLLSDMFYDTFSKTNHIRTKLTCMNRTAAVQCLTEISHRRHIDVIPVSA